MPDRAYEAFVGALNTNYLENGLIVSKLESHNPAGM